MVFIGQGNNNHLILLKQVARDIAYSIVRLLAQFIHTKLPTIIAPPSSTIIVGFSFKKTTAKLIATIGEQYKNSMQSLTAYF